MITKAKIKYYYEVVGFDPNKGGHYKVKEIPFAEGEAFMDSKDWHPQFYNKVND